MTVPQASPAGEPAVPPTTTPPPATPPKDDGRPHDDPLRASRTSGLWVGAVGLGVLLLLLVVFIAQNTEQTTVRFFGFEGRAPLAVSLLVASAAGILLTALAGSLRIWQLRRRTRKEVGREPRRGLGRH